MTPALILACVWALVAGLVAMGPQRFHKTAAVVLIATGLPLLVALYLQNGVLLGLVATAAALSVLRWPALRLLQRLGLWRPDTKG